MVLNFDLDQKLGELKEFYGFPREDSRSLEPFDFVSWPLTCLQSLKLALSKAKAT
jgi:hypothetical protein